MSVYRFAVEHTGQPFAGCIPETAWRELSRHTSLKAAERATRRAYAAMRQACGPGAWNNHYRIVAVLDTTLTGTWYCRCGKAETVVVPCLASQPYPAVPLPAGWPDGITCARCAQAQ